MIESQLILLVVNILMAAFHAMLIKKATEEGRAISIRHGWWGAGYLAVAAGLSILYHSWLLFVASLLMRKVFFDLSLNLFRGKPLFYVSATTGSIIDRVHNRIFGKRSEIYMSIYFLSFIAINYFFLLKTTP